MMARAKEDGPLNLAHSFPNQLHEASLSPPPSLLM